MNLVHTEAARGSPEQLAGIDLNLLVAFDALAREQSVTRAAERMGVTQSAMSHALGRLRDLLRDPLLVRGSSGMTLTPRAAELVVPLRSGLVTLGRALAEPTSFDPAQARRAFCIASPDLFDVLAVPRLLERIRSEAPGVDLSVVPVNDRRLPERLETGEIDVAVVPEIEGLRAPGIDARGVRGLLARGGVAERRGSRARRSGARGARAPPPRGAAHPALLLGAGDHGEERLDPDRALGARPARPRGLAVDRAAATLALARAQHPPRVARALLERPRSTLAARSARRRGSIEPGGEPAVALTRRATR
jgi:DNA-binding transcriptional LysR family regulator